MGGGLGWWPKGEQRVQAGPWMISSSRGRAKFGVLSQSDGTHLLVQGGRACRLSKDRLPEASCLAQGLASDTCSLPYMCPPGLILTRSPCSAGGVGFGIFSGFAGGSSSHLADCFFLLSGRGTAEGTLPSKGTRVLCRWLQEPGALILHSPLAACVTLVPLCVLPHLSGEKTGQDGC